MTERPRQKVVSTLDRLPWVVGVVALLVGAGYGLFGSADDDASRATSDVSALQSEVRNSTLFPDASRRIPEFSLVNGANEPIDETVFDGRWSLLFFGFTHCPDVCPVTLSVLDRMSDDLPPDAARPQIVFMSVDPKRDTPDVIARYTGFFDESIVGITGDLGVITDFTRELGIVVAYTVSPEDPEDYTVDHTASVLLVDPQGRVRAKLNAPHEVESMRDDYITLQAGLS